MIVRNPIVMNERDPCEHADSQYRLGLSYSVEEGDCVFSGCVAFLQSQVVSYEMGDDRIQFGQGVFDIAGWRPASESRKGDCVFPSGFGGTWGEMSEAVIGRKVADEFTLRIMGLFL